MSKDMNKKAWSQPEIISVEKMKHAAGANHNGLPKGPTLAEYDYNGPGS